MLRGLNQKLRRVEDGQALALRPKVNTMTVFSGDTGSGARTSLKQFLAAMPETVGESKDTDPIEYSIRGIYQSQVQRADSNPKAGIFGARKYRQSLKTMVRSELGEVNKGDPLPTPSRQLSKSQRRNRLGYAPAPRLRSSTARGRRAAVMAVMRLQSLSRRVRVYAAGSSSSSQD